MANGGQRRPAAIFHFSRSLPIDLIILILVLAHTKELNISLVKVTPFRPGDQLTYLISLTLSLWSLAPVPSPSAASARPETSCQPHYSYPMNYEHTSLNILQLKHAIAKVRIIRMKNQSRTDLQWYLRPPDASHAPPSLGQFDGI